MTPPASSSSPPDIQTSCVSSPPPQGTFWPGRWRGRKLLWLLGRPELPPKLVLSALEGNNPGPPCPVWGTSAAREEPGAFRETPTRWTRCMVWLLAGGGMAGTLAQDSLLRGSPVQQPRLARPGLEPRLQCRGLLWSAGRANQHRLSGQPQHLLGYSKWLMKKHLLSRLSGGRGFWQDPLGIMETALMEEVAHFPSQGCRPFKAHVGGGFRQPTGDRPSR